MKDFTIKAMYSWAWGRFSERPWAFIGIFAVALIISGISSFILSVAEGEPVIYGLLWLGDYAVQTLISMGIAAVGLLAYGDVSRVSVRTLWQPTPFLYYVVGTILVGLATLVGLVLLIIPGFIAMALFMFAPYIIIDKSLTPLAAMKHSMHLAKGHVLKLILLVLSLVLVNIIGALFLGIGLLVSVPITLLVTVRAYRLLDAQPKKKTA